MEANNKEMREALEKMTDWMEKHTAIFSVQVSPREDDPDEVEREKDEAISLARAALAKPPRNCDVGSAEEQAERYGRYCDKFTSDRMHCETCPCCGKIPFGRCEFVWAQMPYNESEATDGK